MIIAIVLAEPLAATGGVQPYFADAGGATVLEQAVSRVLRGPFGGTVVATTSTLEEECRAALSGFAVQFAIADEAAFVAKAGLLEAAAFRKRWEKAMAAAAQRFGSRTRQPNKEIPAEDNGIDDLDDEEDDDEPEAAGPTDWKSLQKNADVKIRGLARSFECNGVMFFRGERSGLRLETQASLVEAFSRSAQSGGNHTLARITANGKDAFPLLADLSAAKELEQAPLHLSLEEWLAKKSDRVLRVPSDDPALL